MTIHDAVIEFSTWAVAFSGLLGFGFGLIFWISLLKND